MLPDKMTFIDVETTGTNFRRDRIIEVGVIQTENGKIVREFESLVNPEKNIPPEILDMTGIDPEELEKAPVFAEIHQDLGDLLVDAVFVAHNAAFDYGFIKKEFKNLEIDYSAKCLCTVKLSRALFPQYRRHNLDSIIERFSFSCEKRHRAFDDAKVMVDFIEQVKVLFPQEKIEDAVNRILKRPSVPVGISSEVLDALPESPGVYIFYGDSGIPLYIGKSINIRSRVLSHFSSAVLSSTELKIASQVKDIEVVSTEGELGALLKESDLIKEMQPIYNRRLRNASKLIYLGFEYNAAGYKTITTSQKPDGEILGVFKTQKQLKDTLFDLCEEHKLCKKLCGLEKTGASCFGYHLGKCKGACVGEELPVKYNLRFDLAFIKTKIRYWPFDGAVMVSEGEDKFVVDNWRYKRLSEEDSEFKINTDEVFDMDAYKILSKFLYDAKNQKKIRVF